jgi:(+)-trans-carveol dehydrogenase
MTGRVAGKVAFITGAARGQGRSHALRLAAEGADIIGVDICRPVGAVAYPMAASADLAETAREVRSLGRRVVAREADVRDYPALKAALDEGVAELGQLDIVCAHAGVFASGPAHLVSEDDWQTVIDINLTGCWHTCKAAIPHLIERGMGGSIVITNSGLGLRGRPDAVQYVSAKHGLVGLMRTLALELAPHGIRVNSVHPTMVDTPAIQNEANYALFRPDLEHPDRRQAAEAYATINVLPIPWVEPADVSNAVLFLVSDEARYITGVTLPVDAGAAIK